MFEPSEHPRIFGVPPGVDFAKALANGLKDRFQTPLALAQCVVLVNTRRLQRLLIDCFTEGESTLLPRIHVIEDAPEHFGVINPPTSSRLKRQLDMTELVKALIRKEPDLAHPGAAFDLAASLIDIFAEMEGEGVSPEILASLDVSDQSGHWDRARRFLDLSAAFSTEPGAHRSLIDLAEKLTEAPVSTPVIIAGSTGSRGMTRQLMCAVSRMPQGAVLLPGFDDDLPDNVWSLLRQNPSLQDHPQYRFVQLLDALDRAPKDVLRWCNDSTADSSRNKLISLSMRPAPTTDHWLKDGPAFTDLPTVTASMSLIEAPTARLEAEAIATCMRAVIEDGKRVALVSADRQLTREVTSALDRWGIRPDDSAGIPLHLTPPGRYMRLMAQIMAKPVDAVTLMSLLKHPITATGGDGRGQHLLWARMFELHLRGSPRQFTFPKRLSDWCRKSKNEKLIEWGEWIIDGINQFSIQSTTNPLGQSVETHIQMAEYFAAGPGGETTGELWLQESGETLLSLLNALRLAAENTPPYSMSDYLTLFDQQLRLETIRASEQTDSRAMIWGTLEVRSQTADVVILGGLNEGIWPASPSHDPWLNRQMRLRAGLLLPERRIGLAAHDYQLAIAAETVVLSRSKRDAEAETIPSRWLNRLICLLDGLKDGKGDAALCEMRKRGQYWIDLSTEAERPKTQIAPASRPCPAPPVTQRPDTLPVTRIRTLIQDPYAIYAEYVLKLQPLDPLTKPADAAQRGMFIHDVLHKFIDDNCTTTEELLKTAQTLLLADPPDPETQSYWMARLMRSAEWFLAGEAERRDIGNPALLEEKGATSFDDPPFTLTGRTDRIDVTADGEAVIYDYKTGLPPTPKAVKNHDKQLLLTALVVQRGGFETLGSRDINSAAYIGFGGGGKIDTVDVSGDALEQAAAEFAKLIRHYQHETLGYLSRRDVGTSDKFNKFDHLARFGEWADSDTAEPEPLT